jgi:hypothetical protein
MASPLSSDDFDEKRKKDRNLEILGDAAAGESGSE